jgi:putative hydroxymethylpyrimidine transport system permease protein
MTRIIQRLRPLIIIIGLLALWQAIVTLGDLPRFMLPGPLLVLDQIIARWDILAANAWVTLSEIVLGLILGVSVGLLAALILALLPPVRPWLLPILVISQAIPIFALAPLLVLWFGYGLAPKIITAALIIFFPVATTLYDGIRRTPPEWLDLGRIMGANRWRIILMIRMPAALPAFGSGLRVAAAIAPIGAVIGEWVGASAGLGHLMLQANGRMQIDLMFAALTVLSIMAVSLYLIIDFAVRRMTYWRLEDTALT